MRSGIAGAGNSASSASARVVSRATRSRVSTNSAIGRSWSAGAQVVGASIHVASCAPARSIKPASANGVGAAIVGVTGAAATGPAARAGAEATRVTPIAIPASARADCMECRVLAAATGVINPFEHKSTAPM